MRSWPNFGRAWCRSRSCASVQSLGYAVVDAPYRDIDVFALLQISRKNIGSRITARDVLFIPPASSAARSLCDRRVKQLRGIYSLYSRLSLHRIEQRSFKVGWTHQRSIATIVAASLGHHHLHIELLQLVTRLEVSDAPGCRNVDERPLLWESKTLQRPRPISLFPASERRRKSPNCSAILSVPSTLPIRKLLVNKVFPVSNLPDLRIYELIGGCFITSGFVTAL